MKRLFLLLLFVSATAYSQCNLSPSEMKAMNLYHDTTRILWGYQDPKTCVTVAFVRARDGVMVYRDRKRFLELLNSDKKSKARDSIFNKAVLDELLQAQNEKLFRYMHPEVLPIQSVSWWISPATAGTDAVVTNCYNVFAFTHSETKELIQWKIPCKSNRIAYK